MRTVLEGDDKALARRIIQQFVAKVIVKEGRGTLCYTFPFPNDLYMFSYGNLDPRGRVPLTRHIMPFEIAIPASTKSRSRYPDKAQLHETIVLMRQDGMSYREIGNHLDIDASRVWQLVKTIDKNKP